MSTRALLVLALSLVACGDDDGIADAGGTDVGATDAGLGDAGLTDAALRDSGLVDVGSADAGSSDVGATDAGASDVGASDAGFGMTCEGTCAETRLEARFGDVTELFDAAYFGFNADGTLHLEAHGGAAAGCPTMDSPSPDRTLIIGTLPVPVDRAEFSVTATLLDFEGTLTDAPFLSAEAANVRGTAALTTPLDEAFVRFDFDATFSGGTASGPIYATHCVSLDE